MIAGGSIEILKNHIAVVLRKGHLTPPVFNCDCQQLDNIIIIKCELDGARTNGEGS